MKNKHPEMQYLDLMKEILKNGTEKEVFGTDMKIKSVFGAQMRYDLSKDFPLLTTKKVFLRAIIHELLWFLQGGTNIKYLVDIADYFYSALFGDFLCDYEKVNFIL